MALTTAQGSAAYLNRAFNNANASTSTFNTTVADLTAGEIAAANKFDVGVATLSDAALSKQVLTNMGLLPTTNTSIAALEPALADYFATAGKGNRGFVVLQLSRIIADKTGDATYGAAAAAWNTEVADSITSSTGVLTTAADTVSGSASDDIFTALNAALTSSKTLNVTDVIDGGSGNNDTLKIDNSTNWSGFTTGGVSGVETIEITNNSEQVARTFSAAGITGATTYTVNAVGGNISAITDMSTGVKNVNLSNLVTAATATFNTAFLTTAAEYASTSVNDAVALGLNSVGSAGSTKMVLLDLDSFEVINATATGTNNITFDGNADVKTVTLNSSGATTIRGFGSAQTTLDASASTGAIAINGTSAATGPSGATAATVKTIKTGSAASDAVTMDIAKLTANATIDLGAGATDSLTLTASASRAVELTMTGVEKLTLGTVTSTSTLVFSGAKTTGLSTIETTGASTGEVGTAAGATFANMGDVALTINANGASPDVVHTFDHTGATTIGYVTALTTATKNDATTQGSTPGTAFTVDNSAGALTVNFGAYMDGATSSTAQNTISAAKASSVVLNVVSGTSAAGVEKTIYDDKISAPLAQSVTINSTGKLATGSQIDAAKATSVTLVNGASEGNLNLQTPKATLLDITTAKALTLNETSKVSTFTLVDTLKLAANAGETKVGDLPAASSITLSGAHSTSKVTLGTLGATSGSAGNDYNMSITATGLKLGLTTGTIQTGAGYDVTIDVSGVTGPVDLDTINSTGYKADDVTITATGAGGSFDVGTIVATGDVTVKANNVVGTATVAAITGDKVVVDMRGSGSSSYFGESATAATITAKTSVDLSLPELSDKTTDTYTISASAGSTAFALNFNGGIVADTLNFTGVSGQTSVTLTGNMGAGDDVISITSTSSTAAQTINLEGISNYASSTIYSGSGADIIKGGAGADTIYASTGADTYTGGAGINTYIFTGNTSTYLSTDTITDLKAGDFITSADFATSLQTTAITGVSTSGSEAAAVSVLGVATFSHLAATAYDTFAEKVALIDAIPQGTSAGQLANGKAVFFTDSGSTYMFIHNDTAVTSTLDVVVKLTGVPIPTAVVVDGTGGTGLTGFAA